MKRFKFLLSIFVFLFLFISAGTLVKGYSSDKDVNLLINVYYDGENNIEENVTVPYGTRLTFDGFIDNNDLQDYSFVSWKINGVVRKDLAETLSLNVTDDMDITAIYKPTDKIAVVFMDSNGKEIDVQYVENASEIVEPDTSTYSKPGFKVSETNKWSKELSEIEESSFVTLQYEPDGSVEAYILSVTNGIIVGSAEVEDIFEYNSLVKVVANEDDGDKKFLYWEVDGKKVSTQREYTFTMLRDIDIEAVFGTEEEPDLPLITLTENLELRADRNTYLGQFYVPSGYELVEKGIITYATETYNFELTTEGVVVNQSNTHHPVTNEFMMSLNPEGIRAARAYMVVKDSEGTLHTIYSDVVVEEVETPVVRDLFFSEYAEGSSNNKWLEIYNPTNETIDLSIYKVQLYANGKSASTSELQLSGYLTPGNVIVIIHTSIKSELKKDGYIQSSVTNYNGDDAVALLKNGVVLDVIGVIGEDPGTSWSIEDRGSTAEHTLIRKIGIVSPNNVFTASEWEVFEQDYSEDMGKHTAELVDPESIIVDGPSEVMVGKEIQLSATVNPVGSPQSVIWSSNNESLATVDANGKVIGLGEGNVIITITSKDYPEITTTIEIGVIPPKYYSVNATSNDENMGTVELSTNQVLEGENVTVIFNALEGYKVNAISINGTVIELIGNELSYDIENVIEDIVVEVIFIEDDGTSKETVTEITLSTLPKSGGSYEKNTNTKFVADDIEYTVSIWLPNSDDIQGQADNFILFNNDSLGRIVSMKITLRSSSAHTVYAGNNANPTSNAISASQSGNVYTYDFSSGSYSYFKIQNNKGAIYISSIEIKYIP